MAPTPYSHPQWRPLRLRILERDGHACQIQGDRCTHDASDVDHIIPWQEGGSWFDPANLRAACPPCNRARGPRRMAAMARLNTRPDVVTPSREW